MSEISKIDFTKLDLNKVGELNYGKIEQECGLNKNESLFDFENEILVEFSETSHFMNLVRFALSNEGSFRKYFFMPQIDFYKEYILCLISSEDCLKLDKYDSRWPESSVAYFCQEMLKALNYLDQHGLCYGSQTFSINSVGQIKLKFHQTIRDSLYAHAKEDLSSNLVFYSSTLMNKSCRDGYASIKGDIHALGIQAMIFLENTPPLLSINTFKFIYCVMARRGVIALRQSNNFKPETIKLNEKATITDLMSHDFLNLADSEKDFKEKFLPLLLKSQ